MRRRWLSGAVAAAAMLVLGVPAVPAAGAGRPRPHAPAAGYPARLLVYAQEWSLWPSRTSLPAGRVTVQLWNRGMDAHDLRIRRLNASGATAGRVEGVATAQSGQLHQSTWRLGAGTYQLYCSMPGHAARGMKVVIHVR
jgi:plastocyanin